MREIKISADDLVRSLLNLAEEKQICLLDSCGVGYLNSHLLIAGFDPLETLEISSADAKKTLQTLNEKLARKNLASIFTISYDFGLKLENIAPREKKFENFIEPDVFLAVFDCLIVHDYNSGKTFLTGNEKRFSEIEKILSKTAKDFDVNIRKKSLVTSNFTRQTYIETIEKAKDFIRRGDTYQINLTRQIRARLSKDLTSEKVFWRLRKSHPAPFAAFIKRKSDTVVSISPERFFKVKGDKRETANEWRENFSSISVSPIKGTRPRGATMEEDLQLKEELLNSSKDRAENVMIVDLLRNDIGRICKFGTVAVEKLCDLEQHPTLFHLVSTINGELRDDVNFSDVIRAVFPCGSITGAPKIRTMQIIDRLETANRGLSMGAIGYCIPNSKFQIPNFSIFDSHPFTFDMSVAIRTLVVKDQEAIFNVGGGIVFDSDAENEYEETLLKAKAILRALNAE